jgi:tetratricopeptide (TPR) repeat protein
MEILNEPLNAWLLYRYAWACNRMENPADALEAALTAWTIEPDNEWYLAEYMRALKSLHMYEQLAECGVYLRGGGVCRYYLAAAEREQGTFPSPSLDYFIRTSCGDDDSSAADACVWLALLSMNEVEPESTIALLEEAVALRPYNDFYRCLLAENLAGIGDISLARSLLNSIRLNGSAGFSYWQACAELAEAEGDSERRIWALRRARNERICPESDRDLGWALYLAGREALREGDLPRSKEFLLEAISLSDSIEVFIQKSDSLLEVIHEFENSLSGNT